MTQVFGNGHKRAVLYARVSTDEQKESGYGLIGQIDDCRDYAARLGFEIVKEFQEDHTGFSPFIERPSGKQLMEMVAAHQTDAVIVARVDRIARDSLEARIAARNWLKAGIELHLVQNGRITNDNDIVFLIQSWQGQEDYTKIIKNLRDGRYNKARGGRVVGSHRPPYGYDFIRDAKGKVCGLEIYELLAEGVRLIFRWYVDGDETGKRLSLRAIGNKLTALGIQTPAQVRGILKVRTQAKTQKVLTHRNGIWGTTSVSNIISNEVYAGVWRYGRRIGKDGHGGRRPVDEQTKVTVPAIIDRETWERAQAQRRRNAELSLRNGKRDYLLRGFIRCACGRAMSGYNDGRENINIKRRYRCVTITYHKRGEVCREKSIRADYVEAYTWECIRRKFQNLDELGEELKAAQRAEAHADEPIRAELQTIEDFIAQADGEADEIALAMRQAKGRVGESLQRQQEELNARLAGYQKRRGELIAELGARHFTDYAIADLLQFARDVRAGIDNATFEDKRRIMEMLKVTVTVKGGEVDSVSGVIDFYTQQNGIAPVGQLGLDRHRHQNRDSQ
jgi:site-specific DNA recombinase